MAMFLGEISFLLALSIFVAGLVLWHFGSQGSATPLRAAGIVAMLGAALTALCTGYYMVHYRSRGDFESAYPQPGMGGAGMMRPGATGRGMMDPRMVLPIHEKAEMGAATAPPAGSEGYEQHHPKEESQ